MIQKIFLALILTCLPASAVSAKALPVLVSIAPQKWLVERLGGNLVSTHVLLSRGQEPHGFQPTPEQATALFNSRIYFAVGLEFERELIRKIRQSDTGVRVVDASAGIQKISMTEDRHQGHGGESGSGLDPHVWLDPQNLRQMAAVMAEALAAVDQDNAAIYERNLQTISATLAALHEEIRQTLAPCTGQTFLVFHPAFGYFAHAYGLHQEAVEIAGKSPTPKQLYAFARKARADRVRVIFVQPQFDRRNAQTVAQAIGAQVVVLDPLAEDVVLNLKHMAQQVRSALVRQ